MALNPTGNLTPNNTFSPQFGAGTYIGLLPGTSTSPLGYKGYGGADILGVGSGLTIQTDGNTGAYMSTLSLQPQNVLRLTGAFGTGFIQGTDIGFAVPFSGNVGVRVLPSTGQINVNNLAYLSSAKILGPGGVGLAQNINLQQLGSTIQGYGWANCA